MRIFIEKKAIILVGKVKDLPQLFSGIPAHTTLQEYILKSLH